MLIRISSFGPTCPKCGCDTFDDWHREKTVKRGWWPVALQGSLRCHGCGRFFRFVEYADICGGKFHNTMKSATVDHQP